MKLSTKIIVIGGGPAGAVIARELAKSEMDVIVLEANEFPCQKPGDCLPPNIKPLLRKLQLEHLISIHKQSYSNQSVWGSDVMKEEDFISGIHGSGIHINRKLFEIDLAQEARKSGVIWLNNHVLKDCVRINDEWHLDVSYAGEKKSLVADFIVDASGRKSVVGRYLNTKRDVLDKLVGISAVFTRKPILSSSTLIEAFSQGWWYSASLPGNQLIISLMTDSDLVSNLEANKSDGFEALLYRTKYTKDRVEESMGTIINNVSVLKVDAANSSRLKQIVGEGWIAIGDAACTYDPLSSYGITAAIGTAYYGSCAIRDHFLGKKESFLAYNYLMDKMYATYLPLIKAAYRQEKRWGDNVFWKRRS
ncbi:flavin-dependent dehydrogenase [Flavobacterium araucananum]|uniref:FAD-binding domain-containing protein n=1 Tax=Flavobacterium araucananum TaxID=946678 RepID=A0A227PEX4_9FLAO|nr:tryptophan 7-halogenase [Flavobacterium araucananum]OXG07848.1 hypothetical protein B0A64_07620 [Flavobacterium araucananum]PWJ91305.1 flavin-dependent dehydrogenase [Flavobacterium araucananum]